MFGLLRIIATPVVLLALAGFSTPPVEEPPDDTAMADAYVAEVAFESSILPPVVATDDPMVIEDYSFPIITVIPPPPPPVRKVHVPRATGPTPALTGAILQTAGQYIGTPYVHGGAAPGGFDCSGFVQYVYAQNGYSLPRTVSGLWGVGTRTSNPQPGDIILTSKHAALYVAPGWQIDSPRPGKTIQIRPIWQSNPTYIHIT